MADPVRADTGSGVEPPPLLSVSGLQVTHRGRATGRANSALPVLRGVDLELDRGGAVGLVGESGSGKTTLILAVLGIRPPEAGVIQVDGVPMPPGCGIGRSSAQRRRFQPVFQSSLESLNPRLTVGSALGEPPAVHGIDPGAFGVSRPAEIPAALLDLVGLEASLLSRYPRELSGGERQRVAIARALSVRPDALLLDEPVSALDPSVQAGILALLASLRSRVQLATLLVSHDLAVVEEVCDVVHVLHDGTIVESGSPERILNEPTHPATVRLVEAAPRLP